MKYSLRSLMVVVTLVCAVLGGRIEYLRRSAAFHEREAKRFHDEARRKIRLEKERNPPPLIMGFFVSNADCDTEVRAELYHEEMAKACRQAVYRPLSVPRPPDWVVSP